MSKIVRKTASIFGSSAGFQQIAQFGSLAASSAAFSTDPAVIQSLSQWIDGWFSAVLGSNSPAIEDMNAFCYVMAYQLAYCLQEGVGEWDSGTTYYIGSMVNYSGLIYVSLINTNLNQNPQSTADWALVPVTLAVAVDPTTQTPWVMTANDSGKTFLVKSADGAQVFTLPAPTAGFTFTVKDKSGSAGTYNITINHHASETIDGAASYVMTQNYQSTTFISDGTNWYVNGMALPKFNSEVWVYGGANASTNATCSTFATVNINTGTNIVYGVDAVNGDKFTSPYGGLFGVSFSWGSSSATAMGIAYNANRATGIIALAATAVLAISDNPGSGLGANAENGNCSVIFRMLPGDYVTGQTQGAPVGALASVFNFHITQIGW